MRTHFVTLASAAAVFLCAHLWPLPVSAQAPAQELPAIAFLHQLAPDYPLGEDLVIEGTMQGASEVERAELWYRPLQGGQWQSTELELINETDYRALIPAEAVRPPGLAYYAVAYDFLGASHLAYASPEYPGVITVLPPPPPTEPAPPAESAQENTTEAAQTPEPRHAPQPAQLAPPLNPEPGVTVMEAERIRALGARHLLDLLDLIPEVLVERRPTGGYAVRMRGSERPGDVLIRVDGIPVQHPWNGEGPWTFPAPLIERLTVRRGSAVAVPTLGALAGVIDIETRQVEGVDSVLAGGAYATHLSAGELPADHWGSYQADVLGGYRFGKLLLSGFAHVDASSGTQPQVLADRWRLTGAPSNTPGVAPDQRLQGDGGVNLRMDEVLGGTLQAGVRYRYREHGGTLGEGGTFDPNAQIAEHVAAAYASYLLPLEGPNDRVQARLGFNWRGREERFALAPARFTLLDRDGDGEPEVFRQGVLSATDLRGWNLYGLLTGEGDPAETLHLVGGATFWTEGVDAPAVRRNISSTGVPSSGLTAVRQPTASGELTRVWAAAFIDSHWTPVDWFWLKAGLWAGWMSGVPHARPEQAVGPRVSLGFVPHPTVALTLAYRGSTRLPTFQESSDRTALTLPTPLDEGLPTGAPLGGPVLHTLDFDSRWVVTEGPWRTQLSLLMAYQFENERITPWAEPGAYTTRPAHHRLGWGGEAIATYQRRVELYLAATWKRDLDQVGASFTEVTDDPQFGAVLQIRAELPQVGELAVGGRYLGERRNNSRTPQEGAARYMLPETFTGYATFRSVPLWGVLRLGLRAHHLFDGLRLSPTLLPTGEVEVVGHEGLSIMGTVELAYPQGGEP